MSERMVPENQLREVVREEVRKVLAEMLGVQPQSQLKRRFYPTSKAWKELGYDNQDQLYDAITSGLLRVGYEVEDRRKPSAKLSRYYFDIERCQQRLSQLPEKRKP